MAIRSWVLSVWSLHVLPEFTWVPSSSSCGFFKLEILNCPWVWMWVCVWLFVFLCQPCDELATVPCVPCRRPVSAGINSNAPYDSVKGLNRRKWLNECMNVSKMGFSDLCIQPELLGRQWALWYWKQKNNMLILRRHVMTHSVIQVKKMNPQERCKFLTDKTE